MSSRTEKDDPWRPHSLRTADRGPLSMLPSGAPAPGRGLMARDRGPARLGSKDRDQAGRGQDENAGWTLFGYLISGMAVYGGIGWLIGRWTHMPLLFPLGMLVGLVLGIVLIIYKYGRY
jgi:ATP synthase protein I